MRRADHGQDHPRSTPGSGTSPQPRRAARLTSRLADFIFYVAVAVVVLVLAIIFADLFGRR